ncbi:MAG: VWA domain-containing protein [Clostridiales bacterium]|nr:VWA domain-containing protein [Clostridiales bacterium]MDY5468036.1 VWA domain-containing protein [Eubacteriales bacterium]
MSLEFARPLLLLLLPAYIALIYLIDRRGGRRSRRIKHRVARVMRCLLTCLCVLALAAPSVVLPGGQQAVWILADASASARGMQDQMTQSVRTALENKDASVNAGVIAFGGNAMVEKPLAQDGTYNGVTTAVDAQASDLSSALTLASALLPEDAQGRIVVLSDGATEDVRAAAQQLAARGVTVDFQSFSGDALPDAQISQLNVPSRVYQGQSFTVTVQVTANHDTAGTLVLYQNRTPVSSREVTLRRGDNTFTFRDTAADTGVVTYEARLISEGDSCAQNDSMGGYVYVQGAPKLLLVEGRQGEGSEMAAMLCAAAMQYETVLPAQLPYDAEQLRQYDGVVLVNVDYDAADEEQWAALDSAVRVLGRGLTVIGGDSSYALGGYRGSRLEDMLPVTIDVRNKLDLPSLALMLVIDKSGSMSDGMFGTTRLELAKEAAMRAAEVLTPNDQVGVIAFDDAAKWVVNLQKAEDVEAIQNQIGTIRPGGGTAFFTALYEATYALMNAQAQQKHIIFLTDGEAGDTGYLQLCDIMLQNDITLTTVAVGSGADQATLRTLAQQGGGRAYAANEFDNLPKIFTKETYLVSGSYVQNRTFTPVITEQSALTDFDGFPQLSGYLAATEKSLAAVSLMSDREDPILAWWQYGAGRVVAFMADSRGAWTSEFLQWDQAAAFYGGMAAFTLPGEEREGQLTTERQGDALRIVYTAPEGAQTGLSTSVTALLPDGTQTQLALQESAPGVYEGEIAAAQLGAYALRVEQRDASGELQRVMEGGAVNGYSGEYDLRNQNAESTLPYLSALTGGREITDSAEMLKATNAVVRARRDLTQPLLWALMVLLLCDIALRRLNWDVALERYLNARRAARQQPPRREKPAETAQKPKEKPKPVQPEQPRPAPTQTAQQLLNKQKNKKIL